MKKFALILFTAAVIPALSAGYFDDKGWISGWKFAPLQIDLSLVKHRKLVDESSNTLFSFGLFLMEQKSAVFSSALVANSLYNNFGLQINPLLMGTVTENNYGISFGMENYCKKCFGIQLGILNHSWAGETIEKERERVQFCGINIADTLYIGIFNASNKFQIGLLNISQGADFQLGLLNYNPKSLFPWLPLVNWNMERKTNTGK